MRRVIHFTLGTLLLLLASTTPSLAGEVLDGVVATVDHKPVFRSDWDEAVCFEAFMRQKPLLQLTEVDRAAALQRMIDRELIRLQMGDEKYVQPSADDVQRDLARVRAQVRGAQQDEAWRKLLAGYHLTEEQLKNQLAAELQVMNFVEVRLRPNVRVQPDEIEAYYREQLLPALQRTGAAAVSLKEVKPKIRELLTQQHVDQLLEVWLHNLRQQTAIHSSVPIDVQSDASQQETAPGAD
jgi:SurA-like N-terminal domain